MCSRFISNNTLNEFQSHTKVSLSLCKYHTSAFSEKKWTSTWEMTLQVAGCVSHKYALITRIYVKRSLQHFHSYSLCRFHTVYRPFIAHSVDSDQTDSCLPLFTYRLRYLSPMSRPKYKTAKRIPEWEYRTSWVQPFLLLTVLTALLLLITLCRTAIRHC